VIRVRRTLAVARQFARIGLVRKSQFRLEFASQVVLDCIWYAVKIATFEILFLHAPRLADWTIEQVRVFLGFVFVADAFMMMWLGQRWRFGRDLKDGRLDPLRVRPGSPVFLYFFQQFSPEACLNMAVALAFLVFGLLQAGLASEPRTWLLLPGALALGWWTITTSTVAFSIAELHFVHSDLGMFLSHSLDVAAAQPLDVFGARIRAFLLWIVPVGVMTYVPASVVLGRMTLRTGLLHAAWIGLAGLAASRAWRASFKRYESALG
jgi:ABC-2 type transport system permease protein